MNDRKDRNWDNRNGRNWSSNGRNWNDRDGSDERDSNPGHASRNRRDNRRVNWRDNMHDNRHDNDRNSSPVNTTTWEVRRWDHGDITASAVYSRRQQRQGGNEADATNDDADEVIIVVADDVAVDADDDAIVATLAAGDVVVATNKDAVDMVGKRLVGKEKVATEEVDCTSDSSETKFTNQINRTIVGDNYTLHPLFIVNHLYAS